MARKNRRQQPRKPQRGGSQLGAASRPGSTTPAARPTPSATPAPASAPVTRGARPRGGPQPLPTQDAAIPMDRVPFFTSDLRRIAITAVLMFALLIIGSQFIR